MAFTLSHPAAVLPFFPLARDPILMTALVVGSLSPDFGYYTRAFGVATAAHSLIGSVLICIPTGLLVLAFIVLLRKPLLFLMPSRIGGALSAAFVRLGSGKLFTKFSDRITKSNNSRTFKGVAEARNEPSDYTHWVRAGGWPEEYVAKRGIDVSRNI